MDLLQLSLGLPIKGLDAGMVVSRGDSRHVTRNHPIYDLLYVREGVLSVQEEDRPFEVHPGQSLILWPNRLHWGTKKYPADLRYFWLHFEMPPLSAPECSTLSVPQFTTVSRPDVLEELFLRFLHEHQMGRMTGWDRSVTTTLLLLLILQEIADQLPQIEPGAVIVSRAQAYIRLHYRRPLTPMEIAEHVGCTPQHLSRVFRQNLGYTMTDAIHHARLEYARFLLRETDRNVSEIAYSCGFSDARYFYRLFQRYEGMTAGAFRRLHAPWCINVE